MYAVIACPRCRRARVVEHGRKTAACASCNRPLVLADLRSYYAGPHFEEAQETAGLLNARLAGKGDDFARAMLPDRAPTPRHDDAWQAAAASARRATGESDRADAVARALGAEMRAFALDDLRRAFELAGLPAGKAEAHLKRMLETLVVYEPRSGRYRVL